MQDMPDQSQQDFYRGHDSRPIPDPTVLTNQAVAQAMDTLRRELGAHAAVMNIRVEDMERLARQLVVTANERIEHLQLLHDEKFASVAMQFDEREKRSDQATRENKIAVDAALQAARDAVQAQNQASAQSIAKSEAATAKQIDQIGTLVQSTTQGLNDKIDDVKSRLTLIEGKGAGRGEEQVDRRSSGSYLFAAIGAVIGVAGLLIVVIDLVHPH